MMFDFKDINLIPNKCIVDSRSLCSTDVILGKYTFKLPVVPANMECVINKEIAYNLASNGYFYIYHRFNNDIVEFANFMTAHGLPLSISIGVNTDAYTILKSLPQPPDFITIDIAHGHCNKMQEIAKK
jgi:GMP reductase